MSGLSFLQKVVVKGEMKTSTRAHVVKAPAAGADLRVYANGTVYPSEDFVKLFNLEYQPKVVHVFASETAGEEPIKKLKYGENAGNGLDIFESNNYGAIESPQNFIVLAAVSRKEGKLDLFRGCDYDEAGNPKQSVLVQGSSTFAKTVLIPMLEKVYGVKLDKETAPFVDLKVVGHGDKFDLPIRNDNGSSVYNLPKALARGDNKGQVLTVRRENVYLWALVPMAMVEGAGEIILSGPTFGVSELPPIEEEELSVEEAASFEPAE